MPKELVFEHDNRDNASLHALYVRWAMHHLHDINQAIDRLQEYSNGNLLDILVVMSAERTKLIMTNAAYHEAAARLMAGEKLPSYHEDAEVANEVPEGGSNIDGLGSDANADASKPLVAAIGAWYLDGIGCIQGHCSVLYQPRTNIVEGQLMRTSHCLTPLIDTKPGTIIETKNSRYVLLNKY